MSGHNQEFIDKFDKTTDKWRKIGFSELVATQYSKEFDEHVFGAGTEKRASIPSISMFEDVGRDRVKVHFKKSLFGNQVAPFEISKIGIGAKISTMQSL